MDQYPLFMSEFGINQDGQSIGDNYYIGCLLAFTAERDIDWSLWSLQGSYYKGLGIIGKNESYAVFILIGILLGIQASWQLFHL